MLVILGVLAGIIGLIAIIVLVAKQIFNQKSANEIIQLHSESPLASSLHVKKYPESNLEQFQGVFLRLGLVFSLGLVIFAFSWTTYDKSNAKLTGELNIDDFEIEPPQTKREPPPPPPPPPPEIKVVEDEEIIEDEPEILDIEVEEETEIEIPIIEEEEINEEEIFTIVEDMPQFPGGEEALLKYLSSIPYPPIAKENDIEGSVYIRFVVDKAGKVTSVDVARGADKILNEAAVNHIRKMPGWAPGKQRGKPVKVQFVVPIRFRLD